MNQTDRPSNFKEALCAHLNCAPEKYVEEALFRCYFEHAVPVARLLYMFKTESIKQATEAVIQLGEVQREEDVHIVMSDYRRHMRRRKLSRLIKFFEIRLSGKRMMDLFVLVASKTRLKSGEAKRATVSVV